MQVKRRVNEKEEAGERLKGRDVEGSEWAAVMIWSV